VTNTLLSPSPVTAPLRCRHLTGRANARSTAIVNAAFHRQTQIIQCDITVSVAPAVLKTTVAALAQPPFPFESEKSDQTPALNLHSLTPPPVRTPPRFPPSRLFGRLPPCIPSRLRLAGIRKPLAIKDVQIETLPEERCVRTAEVFGRFYVIGAEADPPAKWPFPH
jgi:hypothetical protein